MSRDLIERPHGCRLYRNLETGILRKFWHQPQHGRWQIVAWPLNARPGDVPSELLADVTALLDRIAALEASASEGERRGLEPTDAMVACFNDPMLNPEWVRGRLRAVFALIPEAPAS